MMFSSKTLFAVILALSSTSMVSANATAKADCWFGEACTEILDRSDGCTLPAGSVYPSPDDDAAIAKFLESYPLSYLMGEPMSWCGNRKSLLQDVAAAKIQALQYCFEIGAKSACIWGECELPNSCVTEPPSVYGDPHFKTWAGEGFDFHGICDLMFLESKSHNLKVHIRTTQKFHYSYVSSAAVELNGEVMEFGSWGSVIRNGMFETDDEELPKTFGGYDLVKEVSNKKTHSYLITLSDGFALEIKSYKDMVGVKMLGSRGAFADSTGLMGSAVTGQKLARDGVTVLDDANEFGQEWQVLADEPKLFNGDREPQAPRPCHIPEAILESSAGRRLGETLVRAEAEAACKNWHMNKEACISDVMATGDLELAANVY